jgi:serine/threonine protein kinase
MTEAERLGQYEIVERIGTGGMAETFVAIRRGPADFEQRVCLKRILPAFEDDPDFIRLFNREARIAATLTHANIVQLLDFGEADGSHFLVLELIDGLDLRALLIGLWRRGDDLTTGLVSHLAFELGAALDYAHDVGPDGKVRGVVHRDLSPSNILVSEAGEIKLTDFGIAKSAHHTMASSRGGIKGKIPYMAPEYALAGQSDARSDLFALGVTLYEAMTRERPFDGPTDLATLKNAQAGAHRPLAQLVPTAPEPLVAAIERCILPNPDHRFATMSAFLDALAEVAPPPTADRILRSLVEDIRNPGASVLGGKLSDRERRELESAPTVTVREEPRQSGPNDATRTRQAVAEDARGTELDHGGPTLLRTAPIPEAARPSFAGERTSSDGDRPKSLLPLFVAGGVVLAIGLGLVIVAVAVAFLVLAR